MKIKLYHYHLELVIQWYVLKFKCLNFVCINYIYRCIYIYTCKRTGYKLTCNFRLETRLDIVCL